MTEWMPLVITVIVCGSAIFVAAMICNCLMDIFGKKGTNSKIDQNIGAM